MPNPLIRDRDLEFVLHEALSTDELLALPYFADHDSNTFDAFIDACRRLAREVLLPSYREIDTEPPTLEEGHIHAHPKLKSILAQIRELGIVAATRPIEVGGQQLPLTISTAAGLYLMAGNLSANGYLALTSGAAHLLETFGDPALKARYLPMMYQGDWTGTMALTEPQAGSSLADVRTRATPAGPHHLISGSKIFISGGDHDLTENIVHMVLARIDGAPAGIKGVSLFLVPRLRSGARGLEPNDVTVAGLIHKIGWRGIPSLALNFGESGDCHGYLVGQAHRGIPHMFQMMNEARLMIGANGVATASVAFHESVAYAKDRTQGRALANKGASEPQIPIIEHADVRRMLLRQKAIVEGGMALVLQTARYADLALHATTDESREHAQRLLDLLTPVAKTFPAEKGFESNALAVQVHGGYGYSSEYLPEAWLRDQKLNSLHEGTSGIQGMDLLGRKVVAQGGAPLIALRTEVERTCARAQKAGVTVAWIEALRTEMSRIAELTLSLAKRGLEGDAEGMMLHSSDYLDLFSTFLVAWLWLEQAAAAKEAKRTNADGFYEAKILTAQYWFATELPRIAHLAKLCLDGEDSYARMKPEQF